MGGGFLGLRYHISVLALKAVGMKLVEMIPLRGFCIG
jgi:hypothetical protein